MDGPFFQIRRALLRACQITSSATTFKIEQDTDTTSVWSKNRTRNTHNNSRTEATTLQLLVFLLNCCLLLLLLVQLLFITQTIFDFRGAVRETWDMTVGSSFTFRGYLFSACFVALLFSTKNHICRQLDTKNDSQIHPKPGSGPIFLIFRTSSFCCPAQCF